VRNLRRAGPEARTIPTPARPGGVAMAAIVSVPVGALMPLSLRRPTGEGAGYFLPSMARLICHCCATDRMSAPPSTAPAGGEEQEHAGKNDRQGIHQFLLQRIDRLRVQPLLREHGHAHEDRQHEERVGADRSLIQSAKGA